MELVEMVTNIMTKNGLVMSFLVVGAVMALANALGKATKGRIAGSAIAIVFGLILALVGGLVTGGEKGLSDIAMFSGLAVMGGGMLRDFSIVSTAFGASLEEIKKAGLPGILALFIGVILAFVIGAIFAFAFGYTSAADMATIGAGAVTFIVGPVTGAAVGASSEVVAISIAIGVLKSIMVMIATPMLAKPLGLNNPKSAMIFGGLMGTTSGVAAGLAATDERLVPYGAMTATFYTGTGCLLCPSILYLALTMFF